ncbi:MAG: T9SS type A sorting domain-containing protein, partial [Bacteroidetes bacterium]|nr:T9SS type A sorting domain-containing protein [Bacteroidota bacterium]
PLPAMKEVRSLIYWDLSTDIDKVEIAVYDIYGEKVSGKNKIRIEKQNPYSGYLIWDCSDSDSGIYFINIKLGTRILTLKTIVNR